MPLLQYYITSTEEDIDFPQDLNVEHLHLKAIVCRLSSLPAASSTMLEIEISGIKHFYQINSSTNRANILCPLSSDSKLTTFYPDIIMSGEFLRKNQKIKILDPTTGSAWSDSGGANLEFCAIYFDYVLKKD